MQFLRYPTLYVLLICSINTGYSQEDFCEQLQQSFCEANSENKYDLRQSFCTYNSINNIVCKALKKFREIMTEGSSEWNIPILDPFQYKALDIDIDHPIAKIKGGLNDLKIEDLSKFVVNNITSSLKKLHMDVTLPTIRITKGLYDLNGTIGDLFLIFGKGPFQMTLNNFNAIVDCEIQYKPPLNLTLKSLDVQVKLEKSECNFENIEGGGKLGKIFNQLITDLLPQILDLIWPEIEPPLTKKLMPIVDDLLKKILEQIIHGKTLYN